MEWSRPHAIEFAAAIGLGLLGLLMLARRVARSPDARSIVLLVLRGSALAILVVILLDPIRTIETRIPGEKPTAVYLIDGSRSMSLERPSTRLDQVDRQIRQAESSIAADRMPRIDRYRFGNDLSAIKPGEPPRALDDRSRLLDALERLPSRFGELPPMGVFVFSDGRSTETSGFEEAARGYKRLGVPIHVLPVGDPSIAGDVSIRDLVFPRDAPKHSKVPIKVLVQSRGFDGRRAEVIVRPATGFEGRPLATLPMTLEGGEQSIELVVDSDRALGPMVLEVSPLPGESVAENNAVPFQIASKDRKLRVIYMEGSPDPEYAYIRDALVEDPDIECVAMTVDGQSNFQPRLHRVGDPSKGYPTTREELLTFDVIICSDIARAAFTPAQLEWTVELVAKHGGGFAMIGGHTSFGSGGWDRTAWDGMIPIDMSGEGPGRASEFYDGDFRVIVPAEVESHPIWRIVDDPAKNRQVLDRMPPFHGTNLTDRLKPAATLIGLSDRPISGNHAIVQPNLNQAGRKKAASPRPTPVGNPIFSVQTYGRGRSFAMSTDSTYAWGTDFERSWGEGDNRYFRKFWRNVVRWLAENSTGADGRLEVATDKVVYRPGEPIALTARTFDEKREPTDRYRVVARLIKPEPERSTTPVAPLVSDTPMVSRAESRDFAAILTIPSAGRIRGDSGPAVQPAVVEVSAIEGERVVGRSKIDVQVLDDSEEYRDPRPDSGRLESLARWTGGQVIAGPEDLTHLLERSAESVDRVATSRSPLWDGPAVLGLVFGLLASEWVIRRLKGLA